MGVGIPSAATPRPARAVGIDRRVVAPFAGRALRPRASGKPIRIAASVGPRPARPRALRPRLRLRRRPSGRKENAGRRGATRVAATVYRRHRYRRRRYHHRRYRHRRYRHRRYRHRRYRRRRYRRRRYRRRSRPTRRRRSRPTRRRRSRPTHRRRSRPKRRRPSRAAARAARSAAARAARSAAARAARVARSRAPAAFVGGGPAEAEEDRRRVCYGNAEAELGQCAPARQLGAGGCRKLWSAIVIFCHPLSFSQSHDPCNRKSRPARALRTRAIVRLPDGNPHNPPFNMKRI